jgi:hypothetical protein
MPQVLDFLFKEAALFGLELQPRVDESLEDFLQMLKMLPKVFAKDDYVINVHKTYVPLKTISLWKVAGAFVRPKGITLKLYRPPVVQKADFCFASSDRPICQ